MLWLTAYLIGLGNSSFYTFLSTFLLMFMRHVTKALRCNGLFNKHLPKYHPRDILIIERNTLRYKRKSQIAQNTSDKYRNSELHKMEDLLMNDNLETVQLLPLTSDIVFKQVFGQEESKPFVVF